MDRSYYGKRTVDDYVSSGSCEYRRGADMRELKLFSHRFHFTNPSTMTVTVTHRNEDVVMYIRRQGRRYMSMNESEYRDFLFSIDEINDKIKQCKLVMAGKLPPPLDVEEQSSLLPKSKATLKLERGRSRLVKAKRQALALVEDSASADEDTEQPNVISDKKKVRRKKMTRGAISSAVGTDEEDSDAM